MEVLKLPQSTASRHLAYLRNSNWISVARRGKWMYYRLRENTCEQPVAQGIIEYLASIAQIREDYRVLLQHLEMKSDQICN
jgi:ArsR family transcriptional regulator